VRGLRACDARGRAGRSLHRSVQPAPQRRRRSHGVLAESAGHTGPPHSRNPINYGAVPNGKADDTKAIQKAIDDPSKTTVYFPAGKTFAIEGEVFLRGNIRRLIGCEAAVKGGAYARGRVERKGGAVVVGDGSAPVVIIERMDVMYSSVEFRNETSRTVVLSSCTWPVQGPSTGSGDYFLEDVVGGPFVFDNPKQNIWARQLNTECWDDNILNHGATLWILGLKTEKQKIKILTDKGGKTELLGAHIYCTNPSPKPVLFDVADSAATFIGVRETCWPGGDKPYDVYVRETRGGETRNLNRTECPGNKHLPFFVSRPNL